MSILNTFGFESNVFLSEKRLFVVQHQKWRLQRLWEVTSSKVQGSEGSGTFFL